MTTTSKDKLNCCVADVIGATFVTSAPVPKMVTQVLLRGS